MLRAIARICSPRRLAGFARQTSVDAVPILRRNDGMFIIVKYLFSRSNVALAPRRHTATAAPGL